jgi:quercetin dioxygenase-like cupin family protein
MEKHDSAAGRNRFKIPSSEGKLVLMGGVGVKFKISGDQTGNAFSIVEHPVEPRTLVPPHVHHDTDEYSYVVEGQFGARIGDEIFLADKGDYILKPREIPHAFWNPTDKPARLVEIISPAGFEKFFAEAAELFKGASPDPVKIQALSGKYHASLGWNEWVPELTKKYKLKLFGRQ